MPVDLSPLTIGSSLGIAFGLVLLVKGMAGQRRAARIGDMGSSTISSIAVGEVRISGVVEPAELTLTSPLQSRTCVYYRAKVSESQGRSERTILDEERAVGFRVRDASGDVRVFPRDAHFLVPDAFKEGTGVMGDEPPGLHIRTGGAFQAGFVDREVQIAELLTVHTSSDAPGTDGGSLGGLSTLGFAPGGRRDYEEARIEPGDIVTIVGMALPFDQLADPCRRRRRGRRLGVCGNRRPRDRRRPGRGSGRRHPRDRSRPKPGATPRSRASGSAGRRARRELDPAATRPCRSRTADEAALAERTFEIAPDDARPRGRAGVPLLVVARLARARSWAAQRRPVPVGLLGAILAIAVRRGAGDARSAAGSASMTPSQSPPPSPCGRARRSSASSWSRPTTTSSRSASGSTRPGRTSTSPSSNATTSCRTSWPPSAT